jgi:hypothetical protein
MYLRITFALTIVFAIITIILLTYAANFDPNFTRILSYFEVNTHKCYNVSTEYTINNYSAITNATNWHLTFNANVISTKQYARTTQPVTKIYNLTIQIPSYIDTRLYTKRELATKYTPTALIDIYNSLRNSTAFTCITVDDKFVGLYGIAKLRQAILMLFIGIITLAITCALFIVLCYKIGIYIYNDPCEIEICLQELDESTA